MGKKKRQDNTIRWIEEGILEIRKAALLFDQNAFIFDNSVPRNLPPELVARLDEEDRNIISLYYTQGNSIEQIARILGVSDTVVKYRLFYARGKLAYMKNSC